MCQDSSYPLLTNLRQTRWALGVMEKRDYPFSIPEGVIKVTRTGPKNRNTVWDMKELSNKTMKICDLFDGGCSHKFPIWALILCFPTWVFPSCSHMIPHMGISICFPHGFAQIVPIFDPYGHLHNVSHVGLPRLFP